MASFITTDSFNKTEAAVFSFRPCFLRASLSSVFIVKVKNNHSVNDIRVGGMLILLFVYNRRTMHPFWVSVFDYLPPTDA